MAKIGRNDKCPCRSGKKYKHCCGVKGTAIPPQPAAPENTAQLTLMHNVLEVQEFAKKRETSVREVGVFFFFSTAAGDAWLLEMTDCDCIQLASEGTILKPEIDENPETIEVNWSHTFAINNKVVELTPYNEQRVITLSDAPSQRINAMLRRIRKKFSPEQLRQVHVDGPAPE